MHTTIGRTARVRRSVLAATGVLAVVTMATACGGDGDGTSEVASLGTSAASDDDGDDATESTVDREDAMLEYAECMRDNGIDMPDPKTNGDGGVAIDLGEGADKADVDKAEEECGPIMEEAMSEIEIDPEQRAEMQQQMLDYAECMRDNGIDMPDPKFDENGGAMIHKSSNGDGAPQSSAAESPEVEGPDFMDDPGFEEADEECAGDLGMKMRPSHQVSELGEGGD